jgi:hypothetical protein
MIFKSEFIPKIISGEKTQTRRLVKEGEWLADKDCIDLELSKPKPFYRFDGIKDTVMQGKQTIRKKNNVTIKKIENCRVKWQVGKEYCVKFKRTGKAIIYNPKTGECTDDY